MTLKCERRPDKPALKEPSLSIQQKLTVPMVTLRYAYELRF